MRIGFDAKRIFNNDTGLGHYGRNLLMGLVQAAPENDYILYTPKTLEKYNRAFDFKSVKVVQPTNLLSKTFSSLWRSFGVSKQIESEGLDLYHGLSHEIPHFLSGVQLKIIVTIHDLIYLRHPELFPWVDRQIYHHKFQYACKHSDGVIAISEQTKRDLIEYFEVPEEKIEILYQTCHARFWSELDAKETEAVVNKFGIGGKPYLLYVGSLIERKQALTLVKAYAQFDAKEDLNLVLVGQGKAYKNQILAEISACGLEQQVKLLDNVTDEEKPHLFKAAWASCYPSLFEGFGIPIIESLSVKTPVLTSKGSCFEEAGGPGALYSTPGKVEELSANLTRLWTDTEKHTQLAEQGHAYVQRFHPLATAKSLLAYYQQMLNKTA